MTTPQPSKLMALLNLLEEEARQYEAVCHKLQEKQDVLITGKPKKLPRLDQELTAITHKAKQLEKQRMGLMSELGHHQKPLTQLIETLEPKAASEFRKCQTHLVQAVQNSRRMNQDTRDLLQLSLQWIQATVELIASVITPEAASYSASGNKSGHKKTNATAPVQSTVSHSA